MVFRIRFARLRDVGSCPHFFTRNFRFLLHRKRKVGKIVFRCVVSTRKRKKQITMIQEAYLAKIRYTRVTRETYNLRLVLYVCELLSNRRSTLNCSHIVKLAALYGIFHDNFSYIKKMKRLSFTAKSGENEGRNCGDTCPPSFLRFRAWMADRLDARRNFNYRRFD